MLELRPNCELCNKALPPDSTEAMICSCECTFCRPCVERVLENVCPNCGGGLAPRPIRPQEPRRPGTGLPHPPASTRRILTKLDIEKIRAFSASLRNTPPESR